MLRLSAMFSVIFFALTGCASSQEQEVFGQDLQGTPIAETFFVAPEPANGASVYGLWGGTTKSMAGMAGAKKATDEAVEYRYRITPSAIAVAARCSGEANAAVVTVKARVTALEIASLESATSKDSQGPKGACELSMERASYRRCDTNLKKRCFTLQDGTLVLVGVNADDRIVLGKVRD
jgi:hypothetical protein